MPASAVLGWNASPNATAYDVQVTKTAGVWTGPDLVVDEMSLAATTLDVAAYLEHGLTYSWRVRAENAAGDGVWSPVWTFHAFATPDGVVLVAPADGAADQDDDITLSWSAAARADTYTLDLAHDNAFTTGVQAFAGIAATEYALVDLEPGRTYYWRVTAVNRGGDGTVSPVRSFTVVSLPGQVTLSSPADGADVTIA